MVTLPMSLKANVDKECHILEVYIRLQGHGLGFYLACDFCPRQHGENVALPAH